MEPNKKRKKLGPDDRCYNFAISLRFSLIKRLEEQSKFEGRSRSAMLEDAIVDYLRWREPPKKWIVPLESEFEN